MNVDAKVGRRSDPGSSQLNCEGVMLDSECVVRIIPNRSPVGQPAQKSISGTCKVCRGSLRARLPASKTQLSSRWLNMESEKDGAIFTRLLGKEIGALICVDVSRVYHAKLHSI